MTSICTIQVTFQSHSICHCPTVCIWAIDRQHAVRILLSHSQHSQVGFRDNAVDHVKLVFVRVELVKFFHLLSSSEVA